MKFEKICWFIFLTIIGVNQKAWSKDQVFAEVMLKKLNHRVERVLKESIEARVFVEEDLSLALETVQRAEIIWNSSFSLYPLLYFTEKGPSISLSEHLSFKASPEEQVEIMLEILFHLKRQLEGSTLSLPMVRIQLFARKFSAQLLEPIDGCSLSLYNLPLIFSREERAELQTQIVNLITSKEFTYSSVWGSQILWLEAKERTDAGCRGSNRNLLDLKVLLVNLKNLTTQTMAEAQGDACGFKQTHHQDAITRLIKKMKRTWPTCNQAWANFQEKL